MCQKCGNMPSGHITVVKYKQRIIKEQNFHSNPENSHPLIKMPPVFSMKSSWKLPMHLLPEVRPPLLVWLILTTNSTMNDFIALIFPLECGECRDSATLSDSLEPVTKVGQGGAWTNKEPRHRTQDVCDLSWKEQTVIHWFPLQSDLNRGSFVQ